MTYDLPPELNAVNKDELWPAASALAERFAVQPAEAMGRKAGDR